MIQFKDAGCDQYLDVVICSKVYKYRLGKSKETCLTVIVRTVHGTESIKKTKNESEDNRVNHLCCYLSYATIRININTTREDKIIYIMTSKL
jgi:hypothetical protein